MCFMMIGFLQVSYWLYEKRFKHQVETWGVGYWGNLLKPSEILLRQKTVLLPLFLPLLLVSLRLWGDSWEEQADWGAGRTHQAEHPIWEQAGDFRWMREYFQWESPQKLLGWMKAQRMGRYGQEQCGQRAARKSHTVLRTNPSSLPRDSGQIAPLWLVFSWVKWDNSRTYFIELLWR